ncbi:MAG: hypothetical protein QXO15_02605 [Nitrososphaerota archaeon]
MDNYFERAVTETGGFEPIFKTGIYDVVDLPDMLDALEYINEFIETKIEGGVLPDRQYPKIG